MKVKSGYFLTPVVALSLLAAMTGISYSQEEKEMISPYIQLQYFKGSDNQRSLKTTLTFSRNRMELPLPGMEVVFYTGSRKDKIANVATDEKGIAVLPLDSSMILPVNAEGLWEFSTDFSGNDSIDAASADLAVMDAELEMTLTVQDTVKYVVLNAYSMQGGLRRPLKEETVIICVPRMFSLLTITEAMLDESGSAMAEFPSDLPGDKDGNLTIIARFDEHPVFGNIEKRITEKWGIPTSYSIPTTHRALWTKSPPRWMIITLSILLAGVWGHYLYAIISLIIIKIDAKRKKARDEYRE